MAWKCPDCNSLNNDSIITCTCGYEKDAIASPRLELLQTNAVEDTKKTQGTNKRRAKITDKGDSLEIIIPQKNIFIILSLCVWLVGCLINGTIVVEGLKQGKVEPFLLIWLIIWTIIGVFALRSIAGKEIITLCLTTQILRIEKKVMNIRRAKEYLLSDIKNLRIYNIVENSIFLQQRSTGIWFDYGKKTIKFASGIDEAEVNYIIELFKQKGIERLGIYPTSKVIKKYKGGTLIEKFFGGVIFFIGFFIFFGLIDVLINKINKKDAPAIYILIVIFFWWAYWYITHSIIGRPCPSCKRWRAGEKQITEGSQTFLKCKYCRHEWIIERVDTPMGG